MNQYFSNWEDRYKRSDVPWHDAKPWPFLREVFSLIPHHSLGVGSVLDIGCGTGLNSVALAQMGYQVQGIDVSQTAIEHARSLRKGGADCSFTQADIFTDGLQQQFDVVFDRGCFHHCSSMKSRREFVRIVCQHLKDGASWISIMGDADSPPASEDWLHPTVHLSDLMEATEGFFQSWQIESRPYGVTPGGTSFAAYVAVFTRAPCSKPL